MKKFLAVLLACAMFLPVLASCGSMQAGELDLGAYAQEENKTENIGDTVGAVGVTGFTGNKTLSATVSVFDKNQASSEYEAADVKAWYNSASNGVLTIDSALEYHLFARALNTYTAVPEEYKKPDALDSDATAEQKEAYNKQLAEYEGYVGKEMADAKAPGSKPVYDFSKLTVKLTVDLDMTNAPNVQISGNGNCYFNGVFDGQGHVITGYKITATSNNRSIFGPLYGATIKNVAFINARIDAYNEAHLTSNDNGTPYKAAAFISIWGIGTNLIESVYVDGHVDGGTRVAGIMGDVLSGTTTIKTSSTNFATGKNEFAPVGAGIGGLVGIVSAGATLNVQNCKANVDITTVNTMRVKENVAVDDGSGNVQTDATTNKKMYTVKSFQDVSAESTYNGGYGGAVGLVENGEISIEGCITSGTMSIVGGGAGGIVGRICSNAGDEAKLNNCESNVNISAGTSAGVMPDSKIIYVKKSGDSYVPYTATVTSTHAKSFGGILGAKMGTSGVELTGCVNKGSVTAPAQVGGMIGVKGNTSTDKFFLTNCHNIGDITATGDGAGGLIGTLNQVTKHSTKTVFDGCTNSGTIRGVDQIGGLIGRDASTNQWTLKDCINTGDVFGAQKVGGLVGLTGNSYKDDQVRYIENCENNGTVTGTSNLVSGIVGFYQCQGLNISGTNNKGAVKGSYDVGGFLGGTLDASSDFSAGPVVISDSTNYATVAGDAGYVGGFVGRYAGAKLSCSNCDNKGLIDGPGNGTGGFIGYIATNATVVELTGCENHGEVKGYAYAGGFVGMFGPVSGTKNYAIDASATITSCINYGAVASHNNTSWIGGFIGWYNAKGDLSIDRSENYGAISGKGGVSGFLGSSNEINTEADRTGKTVISNSKNYGSVTSGSSTNGGFVGRYIGDDLELINCENHGSVKGTTHTGGLLGYIHGKASAPMESVKVTGCVATGDVVANRSSGGIIGYIQHTKEVMISDCTVSARLDFTFVDTSNPYVGGVAGQLCDNGNVTVTGCVVTGSLFATSTCKVKAYAGGLVGGIGNRANNGYFNLTNLTNLAEGKYCAYTTISDCVVSVDFKKGDYSAADDKLEVFWGGDLSAAESREGYEPTSKEIAHLLQMSGLKYVTIDSEATNANVTDATAIAKRTTKAIGYQVKNNGNGTYSLRYVFGVKGLSEAVDKAIGFDISIEFADGSVRQNVVYCPNIYSSIIDEQNNVYDPTEYGVDYFFTLVIGSVPADLIKVNGNKTYIGDAIIDVECFTAYNENARLYGVSQKVGEKTVYGEKHIFKANQFSKTEYEVLSGEGVIELPFANAEAGSNAPAQTGMLTTWIDVGRDSGTGIHKLKDSDTGDVYHYYFDSTKSYFSNQTNHDANIYDSYIRLSFSVPEDGYYDVYFWLRLKSESTSRYGLFAIDDAPASEQHYMYFSLTAAEATAANNGSAKNETNPGNMSTWLNTGITLNLEAGTHTITFRMPQANDDTSIYESSFHFRTLYLVPSSAN